MDYFTCNLHPWEDIISSYSNTDIKLAHLAWENYKELHGMLSPLFRKSINKMCFVHADIVGSVGCTLCVYISVYICLCAQVCGSMCPAAMLIHTWSPADERPASCSATPLQQLQERGGRVPRCLAQPDSTGKPQAAHRPAGLSCSKPFIWGLL